MLSLMRNTGYLWCYVERGNVGLPQYRPRVVEEVSVRRKCRILVQFSGSESFDRKGSKNTSMLLNGPGAGAMTSDVNRRNCNAP